MIVGRHAVDETGNKYGKLLVIEKAEINKKIGAQWVCMCDCGRRVVVRGTQLRKGAQKNCGCEPAKFINLSGQRFGKLVVIKRTPNIRVNGTRFICLCDCGREVVRLASSLRSGAAVSCGCRKSLPHGEGAFRSLYRQVEYNAQYRGLEWNLSQDFFRWISEQPCHYCGVEPCQVHQPKRINGGYVFNGIDRVDNEVGYIESNCVPCCGKCNYIKSDETIENFKDWIISVYNHWVKS